MKRLLIEVDGQQYRANLGRAIDISIPLDFAGPQPSHFGAPAATASALRSGAFIGDVRDGGSCNCEEYQLTPHCNGTHTECVGHVTHERVSVQQLLRDGPEIALLLTVQPVVSSQASESTEPPPGRGDMLITAQALTDAWKQWSGFKPTALVLRTTPNAVTKTSRRYRDSDPPPYLTQSAVELIVSRDIEHLLLDLPSLDRTHDEGRLSGHRLFWGLPPGGRSISQARRPHATVTEMVFVPDEVAEGLYLLDLQLAPFVADATPSRPLLFSLDAA